MPRRGRDSPPEQPPVERRRRLSPAALGVTNQKVARAYSPIVIAGAVRLIDFATISLIGIALYLSYVMPLAGFHWEYVAAIFAHDRGRGDLLPGRRHLSRCRSFAASSGR